MYSPKEIAQLYCDSATKKSQLPTLHFIILAILGGAFIAFGGLLTVIVAGGSPALSLGNPGLVKFLAGALFPVGLVMVSIAGADLFTSDCAGMTLSFMDKKIGITTLLKIWVLSYLFNFVGAQLVSYFLSANIGLLSIDPWQSYLHNLAKAKVSMSFGDVFVKAIGANWLVCLGVWMGFAGKDTVSKCLGIWIPVMLFVTLGYEHSIANMFFIPAAIYSGASITWSQFLFDNLIPATLGNILGGAFLVGCVYWLVYMRGIKKETDR